jgi:hypothetical protein
LDESSDGPGCRAGFRVRPGCRAGKKKYISEDGYLETFVVNETPEDVWFDDFMVMSTTSPIMRETQYSLSR